MQVISGVKELKGLDLGKKTEICQIFSMQKFARYFLCRVVDKSNLHALCWLAVDLAIVSTNIILFSNFWEIEFLKKTSTGRCCCAKLSNVMQFNQVKLLKYIFSFTILITYLLKNYNSREIYFVAWSSNLPVLILDQDKSRHTGICLFVCSYNGYIILSWMNY